jgi:hypothetical protein
VAIFAFSKKMCEECAYGMFSMDLTSNQEKSEVRIGCSPPGALSLCS